ncbi:MAG: hypothetical protein ABI969_16945 [bacterium]
MATVIFTNGYLAVQGISGGPLFQLFSQAPQNWVLTNESADQGNVPLQSSPLGVGAHSIGATFAGELGLGGGPSIVGATTYPKVWYTGTLKFTGSITLTNAMPEPLIAVRAFKMSGNLKGYLNNPFVGPPGPAVFDSAVGGKGKAVIIMTSFMDGATRLFSLKSLTYHFMP